MRVTVVGRGLVGSAAARYLAEAGHEVRLVGPSEPADWASHMGPFASSYDSGRITRTGHGEQAWSVLAERSIARYRDLESRSAISFHRPVGFVAQVNSVEEWEQNGSLAEWIDASVANQRFGLSLPDRPTIYEPAPAGFIDPRRMTAAQVLLAQRAGATVSDEVVHALPTGDMVLVAAGAFTPELIPGLAISPSARTIALVESEPMPQLPCTAVAHPGSEPVYWVPPTRYPDGRMYLKAGGATLDEPELCGAESVRDFFRTSGSASQTELLVDSLRQFVPGAAISRVVSKPCVRADTPSGRPFIGEVDAGLYVAAGGNGSAGKSADEIGRLAAELIVAGVWADPELAAGDFAPQFVS